MAYLAVLSASEGRKPGFAATAGIALGLLGIGMTAALGVAALISNSEPAYQALRWGGIVYLLWLSWDSWKKENDSPAESLATRETNMKFFYRGLIVNILNPKAAVFYVAILPGFIAPHNSTITQAILLTITYVLIATTIHSLIVTLAGTAHDFLEDPRRRLLTRRVFAVILAIIALWFALTTGR